ncbi:MAG TPA: DMT family transporter [Ilumatobacteraceae bacterium]|nr:DMT family transporter [Ilumatobacteraceae bacterium]
MRRPGEHESLGHFGPAEWAMTAAVAAMWGSSFLWIAIAIDHVDTGVVPLGRCLFGALVLASLPAARRRIAREDWLRFVVMAVLWMAVPFLLYPTAEQTVSSSITGMMNGGLPVISAVVTALWLRRAPSPFRIAAVIVGFAGIVVISISSVDEGRSADTKGLVLLVVALLCYAIAANVARPMYAKYGSLAPMLWMAILAAVISLPYGALGLARRGIDLEALGALFMLGAMGTGVAFALYGVLLSRAGTVRGMIGIFFTPIVGAILGVAVRDDSLHAPAFVGMAIVIVGAIMVSRPEPAVDPVRELLPEGLLEVGDEVGGRLDADRQP